MYCGDPNGELAEWLPKIPADVSAPEHLYENPHYQIEIGEFSGVGGRVAFNRVLGIEGAGLATASKKQFAITATAHSLESVFKRLEGSALGAQEERFDREAEFGEEEASRPRVEESQMPVEEGEEEEEEDEDEGEGEGEGEKREWSSAVGSSSSSKLPLEIMNTTVAGFLLWITYDDPTLPSISVVKPQVINMAQLARRYIVAKASEREALKSARRSNKQRIEGDAEGRSEGVVAVEEDETTGEEERIRADAVDVAEEGCGNATGVDDGQDPLTAAERKHAEEYLAECAYIVAASTKFKLKISLCQFSIDRLGFQYTGLENGESAVLNFIYLAFFIIFIFIRLLFY